MKRGMKLVCLLAGFIVSATSILADDAIKIYLDGSQIPTEAKLYSASAGEQESKYYLDVVPEIQEDRVYIPINVISKFLNIPILWDSPNITMDYKGKVLTLTIGESTVNKDGELIEIDAEPYISGGRTMVPLRFVAETFGLSVGYKDKVVHIETPEVLINNKAVDVIQNEYYMTMGSVVAESDSNLCINRMRQVFESSKKTEVVAPGNFGTGHDIDAESYYYHQMKYSLLDEKDGLLESYEVYYEISYGMSTDTYVLRDVLNDKWYEFSKEEYDLLIELETIGDWNEISNTVA